MTDWFATLLGPGVANANAAPGPGKTLDSIDQWPKLVSGAAGANPRTEVVLRNDPGIWGYPWSVDGTMSAIQARFSVDLLLGLVVNMYLSRKQVWHTYVHVRFLGR